ncbi:MAG: DUF4143 domain-containing protein [Methanobrevibacter sp.]|nr:DUF4143 domain-containing protein [Methanobrevibacter sp.]
MLYVNRISDKELKRKLGVSGAVLIRGPKACGKTESAKQFAKSILNIDQDEQVPLLMETSPKRLLIGETPRLIDEWQEQPKIWNYIRHEVDNRRQPAQFILAGSANPEESIKLHSGAGRFTTLDMRTMAWEELGFSSGKISMQTLFSDSQRDIEVSDKPTALEFIIEKMIIGGFPGLLGKKMRDSIDLNRAYIDLISEVDISRISNVKRDPIKVQNLLRSIARNTSTTVGIKTLEFDIQKKENNGLSRPAIYKYLDALKRLMIIEEQEVWNTHIRSSASLRKTPKRHFTDVCLSIAALGADFDSLINDLNFTGFLFESLVTHDLRVYAQANDAKVYHYQDSYGLEVDAIAEKYNGEWIAFEIKLGTGQIEEAARNLHKMVSKLDKSKVQQLKSLNIITGTGISYTRTDKINVISLSSLGV